MRAKSIPNDIDIETALFGTGPVLLEESVPNDIDIETALFGTGPVFVDKSIPNDIDIETAFAPFCSRWACVPGVRRM